MYDLPQIVCMILPPSPRNCQGRFTPQIVKYDLPLPTNRPILSKISDTQHHALLHKGLFCERPINVSSYWFAYSFWRVKFFPVPIISRSNTDFLFKKKLFSERNILSQGHCSFLVLVPNKHIDWYLEYIKYSKYQTTLSWWLLCAREIHKLRFIS